MTTELHDDQGEGDGRTGTRGEGKADTCDSLRHEDTDPPIGEFNAASLTCVCGHTLHQCLSPLMHVIRTSFSRRHYLSIIRYSHNFTMLTRSKYFPAVKTEKEEPSVVPAIPRKKVKKEHISVVPQKSLNHVDNDEKEKVSSQKGWEPKNWQVLVDNIRKMRSESAAPVDTQGCHMSYDPNADPKLQRFQVLVSLMLSSQTKDEINHAACLRLRAAGLSPRMIVDIDPDSLANLIKPVGFWRRKIEYLKRTSQILLDNYDGDIPDTVEKLCDLPGVGPKMAHLVMQVAWKKVTGIAVDTHVHRISNRLKFVRKPTKDPKDTQRELEDWMPRELWEDFNGLLVGLGQTICTPISPKCGSCLNRLICPASTAKKGI